MLNLLGLQNEKLKGQKNTLIFVMVLLFFITTLLMLASRWIIVTHLKRLAVLNKVLADKISIDNVIKKKLISDLRFAAIDVKNINLIKRQKKVLHLIYLMTSLLPNNCFLEVMVFDKNGLFLDGGMLGSNQEIVRNFVNILQKKSSVLIKITSIQVIDLRKTVFKIAIILPEA